MAKRFEDLMVWQRAMVLAEKVHAVVKSSPVGRDRVMADQMWRAAVSVPMNIAEGFERYSRVEFARFLAIAKGSCGELRCQLILSHRVKLSKAEEVQALILEAEEVSKMIGGLKTSLNRKRDDGKDN